jgi:O-antigen ligase
MRKVEIFCGAAFAASLLFGGATQKGIASDDLVQAICVLAQAFALLEVGRISARGGKPILALVALIVLIPVVQLIPLAPNLWSALPGRAPVVETYQSAGLPLPLLAISTSSWATERVAFALLCPISIFLGFLACDYSARRRLWMMVLVVGIASILLQMAQLAGGPSSVLRFHSYTNVYAGVGFFANNNHTAAFLYSLIPIAAFLYANASRDQPRLALAALLVFYAMIIVGLAMTASRSALALGALSLTLTYMFLLRGLFNRATGSRTATWTLVTGALLIAAFLAANFGLELILDRVKGKDILEDSRWMLDRLTFEAAKSFFPFGSGLGSFSRAFPLFQSANTTLPATVNHAHNDYLEVLMETGVFGAIAILGWFALAIRAAYLNASERLPELRTECIAATIVVSLLCLHSLWDYPLRTSAIATLFAAASAVLSTALLTPRGRRAPEEARRESYASDRKQAAAG